jgi:hypothetical protein
MNPVHAWEGSRYLLPTVGQRGKLVGPSSPAPEPRNPKVPGRFGFAIGINVSAYPLIDFRCVQMLSAE